MPRLASSKFNLGHYNLATRMATPSDPSQVSISIPRPDKFAGQCDIKLWCQQFELFLSLTKTDASIKRDILLTFLDLPIYQAVITSTDEKTRTYDSVKDFLLKRYSTTDEYIDRLSFFDIKYSSPPEKFASILNELFDLFSSGNMKEELLVARFISSTSGKLHDELRLRRPSTLSECVQIANSIHVHSPSYSCSISKPVRKPLEDSENRVVCFCCGRPGHKAKDKRCPALSASCRNCGKKGHFSNVCKSPRISSSSEKRVNTLVCAAQAEDSSIFLQNANSRPSIRLRVGPRELPFIVDTGSEISVISRCDYDRTLRKNLPLNATEVTLRNFDNSVLKVDGLLRDVHVAYNKKFCNVNFFVASAPFSIIGMDCISALRLNISFPETKQASVSATSMEMSTAEITLMTEAPSSLRVPPRRLPLSLQQPVEEEIRRLLQEGKIEAVANSPYLSPIVVVPKPNNKVRLCVDYRQINKFVLIDQHYMPTTDEIFSKLHGATVFSRLDLKDAFYQIPLSENSRNITAFTTPQGTFRFTSLPFGLACSPAIFARTLQRAIGEIPNVLSYFDDILVFGESRQEHDTALKRVKHALTCFNFQINEEKSLIGKSELEFLGRLISNGQIKIPPKALEAISKCSTPKDKGQLRSFLGFLGYYRHCVPYFTDKTAPLYALLDNSSFAWSEADQTVFDDLKASIVSSLPLSFFDTDVRTKTILTTDASSLGIGGVLCQRQDGVEKPIYFVSRKLHPNETKYSSSELETLAVLWCVERLHQFLFGRHFEIRTDHSALREVLIGKSSASSVAPARIVRWAARLMPYSFTVSYIKGSMNAVADGLSRLPMETFETEEVQSDVSILAVQGEPMCITYPLMTSATLQDDILKQVFDMINGSWPLRESDLPSSLRPFFRVRNELSVDDNLLLRGDRIVPAESLRSQLLLYAHEGHFGMGKTKARLRMSYWWPSMDRDVEEMVKRCFCCERNPPRDSPVGEIEWPRHPWTHLAIDLAGPKTDANGHSFYIIALIDLHSKFVRCKVTKTVTSEDVVAFLKDCFHCFGYCLKVTTDNGVQFTSSHFTEYLRKHGIAQVRSSVYNPEANGAIERMNKNLKKFLSTCAEEKIPLRGIQESMDAYLLNYNNTPHGTTECTPSQLMFQFRPRTRLEVPAKLPTPKDDDLHALVRAKTRKRNDYANERRRPSFHCRFHVGDWVQAPKGPIRCLSAKIGDYTFRTTDGYTVNTRRLRLINRPQRMVDIRVPMSQPRYPTRVRREPVRFPQL